MSADYTLEVRSLSKSFSKKNDRNSIFFNNLKFWNKQAGEQFIALNDISFRLEEGDVLGVVGSNGAGKSTLLKIISRVLKPSSGEIVMKGRIASLLEVGTGFHPELTGLDNIYLNGAILGMKRAEVNASLKSIIEFSDIGEFVNVPVKKYSSGMTVRLGFSVAAHLDSDILIVDEVLAVGDQRFQEKCLGKISDISRSGKTVLFVSHNQSSVRSLCNKAIHLEKGMLKRFGSVDSVMQSYLGTGSAQNYKKLDTSLGDSKIRVTSVEILNSSFVTTKDQIVIGISFTVLSKAITPGFVVSLNNSSGEVIFSSINNLIDEYSQYLLPGNYVAECKIPGNFLNSGRFYISLNCFYGGYSEVIVFDSILALDVQDSAAIRGDFTGDYGGPIRPLLNWKINRNDNDL